MTQQLKAPFPYLGGKSRIAAEVWKRFGAVEHYIEPFAGSLAVLLARPHVPQRETVGDKDAFISNFFRAIQADPEAVAKWAWWPCHEADLHARHLWLVKRRASFTEKMKDDPHYYDPKVAGWWVWGISSWFGSAWCDAQPHLGQRPGLVPKGINVTNKRPHLTSSKQGISGQGINGIQQWFTLLSDRLHNVRVLCGDWSRLVTPAVIAGPLTGVFLDPPYTQEAFRGDKLYAQDDQTVGHAVAKWATDNASRTVRVALCGYEGEYQMPADWEVFAWSAGSASGQNTNNKTNRHKERIWFSPSCRRVTLI